MNTSERRKYERKSTDVGITIFKREETVPATVVNLCEGGMGLHCHRAFFPGTVIYLKLDDIDEFGFYGTVKWAFLQNIDNEVSYRMGVHVEKIVMQPEDGAVEITDRPGFMNKLISET